MTPAFGTTRDPNGRTTFRLWAPSQQAVTLLLPQQGALVPMNRERDGSFRTETDELPLGTPYAFRLDDGLNVPDPASLGQAGDDVHGPSVLRDPGRYPWVHPDWSGRPWHEAVVYELHVGTFTPEGTLAALRAKLAYLRDLGVTALQLMPLADLSGRRGWGYDGVLPYAVAHHYGTVTELQQLVDDAHGLGLMVMLDVVYNHFGPDGNYLHSYAKDFFRSDITTPWGAAIDFRQPQVREYFIANALYWLDTCRLDGLRFDAVHAIHDDSDEHVLLELARRARAATRGRHVHLVLENEENSAGLLARDAEGHATRYTAQWNDDFHHVTHVALTGETEGYYGDYADGLTDKLVRCLRDGFVFQGEAMAYREGEPRGEPSAHLPPQAFINFLHNHDQIGNRAQGERMTAHAGHDALDVALALLLLTPSVPMLFMGEEWGATTPFLFFTDFHADLADAVREGRRNEFKSFAQYASEAARSSIPDPNDVGTFERAKLAWQAVEDEPRARTRLAATHALLELRHSRLTALFAGMGGHSAEVAALGRLAARATWQLADGARLSVLVNLGDTPIDGLSPPPGEQLYATNGPADGTLGAPGIVVTLEQPAG